MKRNVSKKVEFSPKDRLIMVVGNYGSGKTEVAVNLAIALSKQGLSVSIADLDIVNPYFRCREAEELMRQHGIRVVVPPPSQTWADLPIVVPQIKGMLEPMADQVSIFDVGGDDVGAKLLSSFVEPLGENPYALWQVINARRPFTDTAKGCIDMQTAIQDASRLRVTGMVVNTHLMDETTPEIVVEGYQIARQVQEQTSVPVQFVAVMEEFADDPVLEQVEVPLLRLRRHMLPPWVRPSEPAGRTEPIGRPKGVS